MKMFRSETEKKFCAADKQSEETRGQINRLSEDIRKLKIEITAKEKKVAALEKELEEKNQIIRELRSELKSCKLELQKRDTYKLQLVEHEKKEKQEMSEQQKEFRHRQEKTENEMEDLRAKITCLVKTVKVLQLQVTEKEQHMAQLQNEKLRISSK